MVNNLQFKYFLSLHLYIFTWWVTLVLVCGDVSLCSECVMQSPSRTLPQASSPSPTQSKVGALYQQSQQLPHHQSKSCVWVSKRERKPNPFSLLKPRFFTALGWSFIRNWRKLKTWTRSLNFTRTTLISSMTDACSTRRSVTSSSQSIYRNSPKTSTLCKMSPLFLGSCGEGSHNECAEVGCGV